MTLIEMLVAMTITATLLTALAAAFHASAQTVEAQDTYVRLSQTTRITLDQLVAEIRRADSVQVSDDGTILTIVRPPGSLTPGESCREYHFDAAAQTLWMRISYSDGTQGERIELAGKLSQCEFTLDGADVVSISLACSDGAMTASLHDAVSCRRMNARR